MTREEAIKLLREDGCGYCTWQSINPYECENKECTLKEALNMAIKALSQEPTISRLERRVDDNTVVFRTIDGKEIEYVRKEPCDVSVSEKEPNEITEEVTLRFFKNSLKVRWHDFVIYNVEWLKKNWQMEMDIVCGVKPCDDVVSRDMALEKMADYVASGYADSVEDFEEYSRIICQLPPVTQKSKTRHCKECKYFEYDSVAKVDGIPLIVAHEICNKWGNGCKTSEDGYCYLFEPQERSRK